MGRRASRGRGRRRAARCSATTRVADGALRFTPLFPFDPGRQYQVRFDPARRAGRGGRRGARRRGHRRTPGRRRHAVDRRRARLSERRRRAGEPAADVHRVLGADGTAERHRVHEAARRQRARRFPARSCRSTTSSGAPITRASPSFFDPGPREGRHPAEPADGPSARSPGAR